MELDCLKKNRCKLLIDSGADISILKIGVVKQGIIVDVNNWYNLNGITAGNCRTMGTISSKICFEGGNAIDQIFSLVPDEVPLLQDGILGRDFLIKNKVMINFHSGNLVMEFNGGHLSMSLSGAKGNIYNTGEDFQT